MGEVVWVCVCVVHARVRVRACANTYRHSLIQSVITLLLGLSTMLPSSTFCTHLPMQAKLHQPPKAHTGEGDEH